MGRIFHIFGKKKLGLGALMAMLGAVPIGAAAQVLNGEDKAAVLALPSGLPARQHETLLEPIGVPSDLAKTVRVRFVAEPLADRELWGFDRIEADFEALCRSVGLDTMRISAPNAERVIISIASQATDFGESVPNVVQYFDSFLVQNNTCIWEGL